MLNRCYITIYVIIVATMAQMATLFERVIFWPSFYRPLIVGIIAIYATITYKSLLYNDLTMAIMNIHRGNNGNYCILYAIYDFSYIVQYCTEKVLPGMAREIKGATAGYCVSLEPPAGRRSRS